MSGGHLWVMIPQGRMVLHTWSHGSICRPGRGQARRGAVSLWPLASIARPLRPGTPLDGQAPRHVSLGKALGGVDRSRLFVAYWAAPLS
jgi:hypothetical protein